MAQIGDLIARLFSNGGTRGLSGDADLVLPPDPDLGFYNEGLRRHQAEGDLVADPGLLWDTGGGLLGRSNGARSHLDSERGDGVAGFTDVLIILNQSDWRRTYKEVREPWVTTAEERLASRFQAFCEETDFHQLFPSRPMVFHIVEDGGPETGSQSLGLTTGEFVTGILPNHYFGPRAGTKVVISVHLNLPGQWEGYREVGRLYSDQVLFTMGSHWLDNFNHPALQRPALYRLQQFSDGSFVHIINPDVQDQYRISSQETAEGPSVLTLEDFMGDAVAHLVLAVVDEEPAQKLAPAPAPAPAALGPAIDMPRLPSGAPSMPLSMAGSRTVVPTEVDERILTLRESGALLQKVHFGKFMEGYNVYVGDHGEVGTHNADPAASLQVRGRQVSIVAHKPGVSMQGLPVPLSVPVPLEGEQKLGINGNELLYLDLTHVVADGWPYLGELRRPGGTAHMVFGNAHTLGRDLRCKVRLPDEPENDNIVWRPEMQDGGSIRSRTGEIPKSRFYTDSIMVASKHAEIDLSGEPVLHCKARHCFSYVRRGGDVFALFPTKGKRGPRNMDLQSGDEILIGNCVFAVQYPPAEHVSLPSDTPGPLTPSELAAAAGSLADYTSPPELPLRGHMPTGNDLPAAAGLGERGPAPPKPEFSVQGVDSILGVEPPMPPKLKPAHRHHSPRLAAPMIWEPEDDLPVTPDDPAAIPDKAPPPVALDASGPDSILEDPPAPSPAPATPAPQASEAPDAAADSAPGQGVVAVDENEWQMELSRSARLCQIGWMVGGELVVGNHLGADLVVPENREEPQQTFNAVDYFKVFVRGRRLRVNRMSDTEAHLEQAGSSIEESTSADGLGMRIVRRAFDGEEDFDVSLSIAADKGLPDPRARRLHIDLDDRMVQALFTLGMAKNQSRRVRLGHIEATALWEGDSLQLTDYLAGYARPDGSFRPFFVRHGEGPFRTVPEDGTPMFLEPGDQLIAGTAIFRFER